MNNITIIGVDELDGGWLITAEIAGQHYQVGLSRDYYQQLTNGACSAEVLVRISFDFLLQRESADSILARFELPTIQRYFPEYETTIMQAL